MSKIKPDYANNDYKSYNYSMKTKKDTLIDFFGLIVISSIWGVIVVHIIVEITK